MQGGTKKMYPLKERQARLWHMSLRLWMWKWQIISPEHRALFYRKPGYIRLPAVFNGHYVFPVYHQVWVQPTDSVWIPSNFVKCSKCKLMGTMNTMQEYHCN